MISAYAVGVDGKYRRYEILIDNDWVPIGNTLPVPSVYQKRMRGYRVFELPGAGGDGLEVLTKTFIEP